MSWDTIAADEFPFARIQEFLDFAGIDPAGAVGSLLADPDYQRVEPSDRADIWQSILYTMRSTWTPEEVESAREGIRDALPPPLARQVSGLT